MDVKNLDRLKPFEVVQDSSRPYVRYTQDEMFFNCGGRPIVEGKVRNLPNTPQVRKIELKLNRPNKTAAEAARDAQQMIEERDGVVHKCGVCDKVCKSERGLALHMTKVHPGIK